MVEGQIAARGIADARVLGAMQTVPRHLFLEEALSDRAYDDSSLPIGEKQTISQPYIVALMTQALALQSTDKVLEIGTGSGYQTAILAELAARVYSIERVKSLALKARERLDRLGYRNVAVRNSDGTYGWEEAAPFGAILVAAGSPSIPPMLVEQLREGGRLVIPVAHNAGFFWPRRGLLKKRGTVRVVIGPPIAAAGRDPRAVNEEAQQWIEARVRELAPTAAR